MRTCDWFGASIAASACGAVVVLVQACGGGGDGGGAVDASTGDDHFVQGGDSASSSDALGEGGSDARACVNLQCRQHSCDGASTTISGTVYDPAGKNPLYGVVVYVPNSAVGALPSGASCVACDTLFSGSPIAAALTDAQGKFTLANVPDGADIPLVIQVGKWRKQLTIPSVTRCQDNPQADKSLTLPKNHHEGDLPNIAISTGASDTLECLLSRVGIDASEYGGADAGTSRIHIFHGGGVGAPNTNPAAPDSATALWASTNALMAYDMVMLSCEGTETSNMNQQALHDYASAGGRVFASHFHYAWFNTGPYGSENLATWVPGSNDLGNVDTDIVTTLPNNQAFPKGQALMQWLGVVGALTSNKLPIQSARHNADVTAANAPSQRWIFVDPAGATEQFSFNTPTDAPRGDAGAPNYCGRIVYSALHVGASGDNPALPVPTGCMNAALSPQEKALEFMLFDLSSCVTPESQPPHVPRTPPPPN